MSAHFSPDLFAFLRDLAANNRRDWFEANRSRYDRVVRTPALDFIRDFASPLEQLSPFFEARPSARGGSLFRIHRDVRFSHDKSPYKTTVGIQFRHVQASRDVHAPGFYVHLAPGDCFCGAGSWRPPQVSLTRIRERILLESDQWRQVKGQCLAQGWHLDRSASLKRAPRGVPADHPEIEDLRLKSFALLRPVDEAVVTAPGFLDHCSRVFATGLPFLRFLCGALELPC